jgi:hypothetical protein
MTLSGTSDTRTASVLRRQRTRPPCPCGECSVESGFCPEHAARLGQFRESFNAAAKAKTRDGKRAKSPQRPQCCRPGCPNDRTPPAAFCDGCAEDGYVDGIGE